MQANSNAKKRQSNQIGDFTRFQVIQADGNGKKQEDNPGHIVILSAQAQGYLRRVINDQQPAEFCWLRYNNFAECPPHFALPPQGGNFIAVGYGCVEPEVATGRSGATKFLIFLAA
jgi:hypothetical protein